MGQTSTPHLSAMMDKVQQALDDLFALVPAVIPDPASFKGLGSLDVAVFTAQPDGEGRLLAPVFWIHDSAGAPASAHQALQRATTAAPFVACMERLDIAARAIAPGLWAQITKLVVYHHPAQGVRAQVHFSQNKRGLRISDPDLFARSLLWMLDAAQGIPQGTDLFAVFSSEHDTWARYLTAASPQDAAALDMVLEKAHQGWDVPVEVPQKVHRVVLTGQDAGLLSLAHRLNTIPRP